MSEEMTDNAAGSETASKTSGVTTSGVTSSGTASEALLKAAAAASSADGASGATKPDSSTVTGGAGTPPSTPGATGQPLTAEQQADAAAAARGEAPQHRIEAAVRNAREQATREVEARYAHVRDVTPEQVNVLRFLRTDAEAFYEQLGRELGRSGGQPKADPIPEEGDLVGPNGVRAFSDKLTRRLIDQAVQQAVEQVTGQMRPLMDAHTQQAEAARAAEFQRSIEANSQQVLTEARKLPHFTKENEPAILKKLQAIPQEMREQLGAAGALYRAYNEFLVESVYPTLDTAAESRVRAELAKKAHTTRGQAHPADQGGDGKKVELNTPDQLARHMERLAAAATA